MIQNNTGERVRILMVDDEPTVLRALQLLLGAIGYTTIPFNLPQAALDYINQELAAERSPCDIILSDLRMPLKDGMVVLQECKIACSYIPFIMMSGHATEEDRQRAFSLGCDSFLSKPFSPEQFNQVITETILARAV